MSSPVAAPGADPVLAPGIGLVLPTFPQGSPPPSAETLGTLCRDAEAAGAAGLWACDHLFWHGPSLECLAALAVAATASRRALVGSCVLQLPLRRPSAVAKTATTLQNLSGGRFVLGVGVGVHAGEYEATGIPFAKRGRLLDAGIDEVRRVWATSATDGTASRYRQLPGGSAPIWVGGSSPAALERAAANDGWIPLFVSPEEYSSSLALIEAAAARAGRDPATITPAVVAFVSIGGDGDAGAQWMSSLYNLPARAFGRYLLHGSPRAVAGELARFVEHGARHVAVFVTDDEPAGPFVELARAFADVAGTRRPAAAAVTASSTSGRDPGQVVE